LTTKSPKLLFAAVGLHSGSGGAAELSRQAFAVMQSMQREGQIRLEVYVLEGAGPKPGDELFHQTGCAVRWFDGNRRAFSLALLSSRADLRVLDHVGLARVLGLIPQPFRPAYALFIHGLEIWGDARADYIRTAKNADLLIANSQFTVQKTRKRHSGLPPIRVCWPGKDGHEINGSATSPHTVQPSPHAILIVGRLSAEQKHKGHDHLIEAMPAIVDAVPDAMLIIAGGGDDQQRLEGKARKLQVNENVVFTGWVNEEQLHLLYSKCALFAMPSEGDGFGIVFLEAMMHGKPCVGLKTGSAAEVFEDGKSGILVDREDTQGMAQSISALLIDENRRAQMGQAALERYRALFQGEHYSARLRAILMEHLGV
jgi:phosphatidylinositol alpha-1,6-mannosyltransferase